ncbi:MAG: penicillin-binding protein activator [Gammaproteobacteria bacterium]|nr:penicillin-binding protein activator [Gammaproteobacteria bacterium]
MLKKLTILFLFTFTVFLSSCSSPPKKPVAIEDKVIQKVQTPYEKYKTEFKSTLQLKQPLKNKKLLSLLIQLSSYLSNNTLYYTEAYKGEVELLTDVKNNISIELLSLQDKNTFQLLSAVSLFQTDKLASLKSLIPDVNEYNLPEKILAYRIQSETINQLSPLNEIKTNLILYFLNEEYYQNYKDLYPQTILSPKTVEESSSNVSESQLLTQFYLGYSIDVSKLLENYKTIYLTKIWQSFSNLSMDDFENLNNPHFNDNNTLALISTAFLNPGIQAKIEKQLNGWKILFTLVKQTASQYLLKQKIQLWKQQFPNHMANNEFIDNQLTEHFKQVVSARHIALLLPQTGKYATLAQYIQHGFLASHYHRSHQTDTSIKIYDTGSASTIWPLYREAVADGADVVVGPLDKRFIAELAEESELPVVTLALNQIITSVEDEPGQNDHQEIDKSKATSTINLFQFALKPEQEIAQITQKAFDQGYIKAALLSDNTQTGKRHADSFQKQWTKLGGQIVSKQTYKAQQYDFNQPITELLNASHSERRHRELRQIIGQTSEFTPRIRHDIDVIFLYATPEQGKQIPLQIDFHHGSNLPIYATSRIINEAFNVKENKDLEGIIYPDMNWLIDQDIKAVSRQSNEKIAYLQRFFSFGVDSYRILPFLNLLKNNHLQSYKAESGLINIENNGLISCRLKFAQIKNGLPSLIN